MQDKIATDEEINISYNTNTHIKLNLLLKWYFSKTYPPNQLEQLNDINLRLYLYAKYKYQDKLIFLLRKTLIEDEYIEEIKNGNYKITLSGIAFWNNGNDGYKELDLPQIKSLKQKTVPINDTKKTLNRVIEGVLIAVVAAFIWWLIQYITK